MRVSLSWVAKTRTLVLGQSRVDLTRRLDPIDPLSQRQRIGEYSYIWLDLDGLRIASLPSDASATTSLVDCSSRISRSPTRTTS